MLAQAEAKRGILQGRVSAESGEKVANATLTAEGAGIAVQTDARGRFELKLPAGSYTVSIEHPDYSFETIAVDIRSGQTVTRDIELAGMQALEMEEVKVTASHMKGSMPAFMEEERASPDVVDALSAEQMARAGDTYVTDGLKRVPGVSLVEDKYVYVRGLGERYSSVLLNGARLSSTDPTRRVMELDFYPGEVLEGIVVQKSYSPDIPAAFAGGTVLLRPRSYPDEFFCKISASSGYRQDTTFEDGNTYNGGDLDFLGIDDDSRDLPVTTPPKEYWGRLSDYPGIIESMGENFPNNWDIDEETVPPDMDFSVTTGNQFRPGDGKYRFGFMAAARYEQSWQLTDQQWKTFDADGNTIHDYDLSWSDRNINTGAFLNLGARLGKDHKIVSSTMLLRDTLDSTRLRQGYFEDWDTDIQKAKLIWLERQTLSQQVSGDHDFPAAGDLGLNWQYTYSKGDREEPDRRSYTYAYDEKDDIWELPIEQDARNSRTWSDMSDTTNDFSFDLELPTEALQQTAFKTGFKLVDKSRDFDMRRFTFDPQTFSDTFDPDILDDPIEAVFSPEHINSGEFVISEYTRPSDEYTAEQTITGVYAMADSRINDYFGLTGGVRYESSDQEVTSYSITGTRYDAELDVDDYFPSLSATWYIGGKDKTKLRLAYSSTTNRPDFKELSRSEYTDPVTGLFVVGNPDLREADITSYDLRFEHFFSPNENVALSLFYKDFDNPIEKIRKAAVIQTSGYVNSDNADLYGVEVEALKYLDFLEGFENFFVGGNFAWLDSEVSIPEEKKETLTSDDRQLQGQPDWVLNLNLGYE
ncbi:MAG TPA: TonB-dependent receptor, partial [Desulfosalsimonadaceae bacterium]|nr:TonB-dependent receptor [Desulfosalsimonadaceae bacterium]